MHLIQDAQQEKAKHCLLNLDKEACFWLKDFSQKFKFREGQKDYFEKKGMIMHIDVFFLKRDNDTALHYGNGLINANVQCCELMVIKHYYRVKLSRMSVRTIQYSILLNI
jgi:hypothetical protein